jgi:hypothetical protein
MSAIGSVFIVLGILGLSFWVGWGLAKAKAKKQQKKLEEKCRESISQEEFDKTKEEDNKFWNIKKEVEDARKRKYRKGRNGEDSSESSTGEPRVENEPSSSERKPIQNNAPEQPSSNDKAIELHSVSPIGFE